MATLHEQVGMRIGLTLTDSTVPSKAQVESFLQEGLNRVQTLLDPEDLWPLTKTTSAIYVASGVPLTDLVSDGEGVTGYAQIITVMGNYGTNSVSTGVSANLIGSISSLPVAATTLGLSFGDEIICGGYTFTVSEDVIVGSTAIPIEEKSLITQIGTGTAVTLAETVRATEVPAKDWHKASNSNSMYYGTLSDPVFSYKDGKLVIKPAPSTYEVNYIGTLSVDANLQIIPNVPSYVASVVINYATAQAASMLAAHYAQEEDPISQQIMAIAQTNNQQYADGLQVLLRKSKVRGNIS
jgi:hypothetical protein